MSSFIVWHSWWLTSTEHFVHGKGIGKHNGIGIGSGIKVGRIQVKFDNVPFDNVANKFDGEVGSAGGSAGAGGGGRGGRNGYWNEDDHGMFDGKRSEGCQARLTGRLEGVNDDWSTRRIFPLESDDDDGDAGGGGDDDRWRFDEDEGVRFRGFCLEFTGIERRCGIRIFRRLDSINWCSGFFFSED